MDSGHKLEPRLSSRYNVEIGRPRVILFIYFSLSPDGKRAGNRGWRGGEGIREERTVAINEPVKFPASVY